jgi:hypothetical protein
MPDTTWRAVDRGRSRTPPGAPSTADTAGHVIRGRSLTPPGAPSTAVDRGHRWAWNPRSIPDTTWRAVDRGRSRLRLHPSIAGRLAIRARHGVEARVLVRVRDADGTTETARRSVTLRPPHR